MFFLPARSIIAESRRLPFGLIEESKIAQRKTGLDFPLHALSGLSSADFLGLATAVVADEYPP